MQENMLPKSLFDMLYLIRCSLNGNTPDSERVSLMDIDEIFSLAKKQSLTAIVGHSVLLCNTADNRWQDEINRSLYRIAMFDAERAALIAFLEREGIWYMPLKGLILMNYYPQVYMRQMSDNDILFDRAFQTRVKDYFLENDYEIRSFDICQHDSYQKEPIFNFEMHTKLYSETSENLFEYYKDVKSKLIKDTDNSYGYHMSNNDFYIYTVSHAYKHYVAGGIGIKLLLDCYICYRYFGNMLDYNYIENECKKAGFSDFEKLIRNLSIKLFSENLDNTLTDEDTSLLQYCLSSGTHGSLKNRTENRIKAVLGDKKKLTALEKMKFYVARLFPKPVVIYERYPFFRNHRWLLPFAYPYRIIHTLIKNPRKISMEIDYINKYE